MKCSRYQFVKWPLKNTLVNLLLYISRVNKWKWQHDWTHSGMGCPESLFVHSPLGKFSVLQNYLPDTLYHIHRVPTGPYFREKSLFSIVALEKSLLLNIFDRSPGKVLIFNRCVKTWMINIVLRKLRFSKCCGNDVELFGNPSDPLTNHRWRVVWRHLVPAKIPRASFIKFYYVVTLSQSADTWCHVVVVRNLIGPQSRRYTWRTLRKTSSIFVEIRQHT